MITFMANANDSTVKLYARTLESIIRSIYCSSSMNISSSSEELQRLITVPPLERAKKIADINCQFKDRKLAPRICQPAVQPNFPIISLPLALGRRKQFDCQNENIKTGAKADKTN